MNPRRFSAASAREALRAVKRELGEDAVILSNRSADGRVEITALAAAELDASGKATPAREAPALSAGASPASASIIQEIQAMRGVLEAQLGGLVWGDLQRREPAQARLLRELLACGFSPGLARFVSGNLPKGTDAQAALAWVRRVLAQNLRCAAHDEIVAAGGVYALVGPTGVGKTTTAAKIAARGVVRYGAERVALLTTDTFRIGAHEQLRIYGRILGVPVHAVRDAEDLRAILTDLRAKSLVLIDTVGMSQRDKRVAEQLALLAGARGRVQRLLLLAASSGADALDESVRAYGASEPLAGVVLTKLDEAVTLGGALDVLLRRRLKLHYLADGQRVPEDLRSPVPAQLAQRAMEARSTEPALAFDEATMPAVLGAARGSGLAAAVRA